jgi:hypothetical protein
MAQTLLLIIIINPTYAITVFVAESDGHHSLVSIAGTVAEKDSVAEGDEQIAADCCSLSASGSNA